MRGSCFNHALAGPVCVLNFLKTMIWICKHGLEIDAGISKLEFDKDGVIKSMVSSEGELVPFKRPIDPAKANGAVEKWLAQVSLMWGSHIFVWLFS